MCEWHCEKAVCNALHKKRKINFDNLPFSKFKEIPIKKKIFPEVKHYNTITDFYSYIKQHPGISTHVVLTNKEEELEKGKLKRLITVEIIDQVKIIIESFSYKSYLYFQKNWIPYLT